MGEAVSHLAVAPPCHPIVKMHQQINNNTLLVKMAVKMYKVRTKKMEVNSEDRGHLKNYKGYSP